VLVCINFVKSALTESVDGIRDCAMAPDAVMSSKKDKMAKQYLSMLNKMVGTQM